MRHRRTFAVLGSSVAVLLASLFGASSALADSPRGGTITVVKNCAGFVLTPPTCIITASDARVMPVGTVITYLQPGNLLTPAGSDVVITTPHGSSKAFGNCALSPVTFGGVCTLNGGTGKFRSFHAHVVVTYLGGADGNDWGWFGTYSFSHPEDD